MSHALATVRHDGRRPSVTPGTGYHNTWKPPKGGDRLRLRRQPQAPSSDYLSPLRGLTDSVLSHSEGSRPRLLI